LEDGLKEVCVGITVLKFGGEIAENKEQLQNLVYSLEHLQKQGEKIILIHGGGPSATELSKKLGIKTEFIGGRRVTDLATLEVMKMTLPGLANTNVLAMCKKNKINAVTVSGLSIVKAIKRPPVVVSGSDGHAVDFGYVGDVIGVETKLLFDLLEKKYVPIVSPLACDEQGQVLNINADTVAVQIAQAMGADKFVFITTIGGVFEKLEDNNSRFTKLTVKEAKNLITQGTIQGGMIPKLEEAFILLDGKLSTFHIVGLHTDNDVQKEIEQPGSVGTVIVK
jgi:acetylglutamate kinase